MSTTGIAVKTDDPTTLVQDVLPIVEEIEALQDLAEVPVPDPLKPAVAEADLSHRCFDQTEFWKKIPAFAEVDEDEFLSWKFQNQNSVRTHAQLDKFLQELVEPEFLEDVREGLNIAPMNMRLSPYILSRVNWDHPYDDPVRRQFIPTASTRLPDHPMLSLDSLHEQKDSPVPGLVHRYPDKVLFLPLDVCPVYCRFCTRSYAIGGDTETVDKHGYKPNPKRWEKAFAYIASRPEIEDVVISGGDTYMLSPQHIRQFGETLLSIPHIRRIRFATKGPAVMPMKILTHDEWTNTIVELTEMGRELAKEVCIHTHFNTVNEISQITKRAMDHLFKRGVKVRNQAVMIRGVNDSAKHMKRFNRMLSYMNVQPYYVYQHDMVSGVDELRTAVRTTSEIERHSRGSTAGFNTPLYITDVPGGGGKRDVHSWDHYDEELGISIYRSPNVDKNNAYLYFDPIDLLPEEGRKRWENIDDHRDLITQTMKDAGMEDANIVR